MKSFDKMLGRKYSFNAGTVELELEVGSYCVFDQKAPSNGSHFHNCYEIAYVTGGKGNFTNNDTNSKLGRGSVFIAEPDVVHEITRDVANHHMKLELVYILFRVHPVTDEHTRDYNEKLIRAFVKSHQVCAIDSGHVAAYMQMIDSYEVKSKLDEHMLIQIYGLMLLEMIRTLVIIPDTEQVIPTDSKSLIDIAMVYIRENVNRRITVTEVASVTGTSVRNLQYLFRKYLDMTVIAYINERKINLACSYLKMNNTVGATAKMVGIEDTSQFSRLFSHKMGISPKKYQKQYATSGIRFAAITDSKK